MFKCTVLVILAGHVVLVLCLFVLQLCHNILFEHSCNVRHGYEALGRLYLKHIAAYSTTVHGVCGTAAAAQRNGSVDKAITLLVTVHQCSVITFA
jgi:hypothetical protein